MSDIAERYAELTKSQGGVANYFKTVKPGNGDTEHTVPHPVGTWAHIVSFGKKNLPNREGMASLSDMHRIDGHALIEHAVRATPATQHYADADGFHRFTEQAYRVTNPKTSRMRVVPHRLLIPHVEPTKPPMVKSEDPAGQHPWAAARDKWEATRKTYPIRQSYAEVEDTHAKLLHELVAATVGRDGLRLRNAQAAYRTHARHHPELNDRITVAPIPGEGQE